MYFCSLHLRWNNQQKRIECRILTQGLPEPPPSTAAKPLPPTKTLLPKLQPTPPPPHQFINIASLPTKPPTQPQLPTALSTSAVQYNSPSNIPIPRTTQFHQKKRKEREESGEELPGSKRTYQIKQCFNTCKYCKLPKTKDLGHSRHIGINSVDTFCPALEGKQYDSKEAWMAARKTVNPPKPKVKSGFK